MSEYDDNQVFYRPRCFYFRMIFHREPNAEEVRAVGTILCKDCDRVYDFADRIGLTISSEVLIALRRARFAFLDPSMEMGKVRWRGLKLCRLIEPLHLDIRNYGQSIGVELYPPKFYQPPEDIVQALSTKPWEVSLAG